MKFRFLRVLSAGSFARQILTTITLVCALATPTSAANISGNVSCGDPSTGMYYEFVNYPMKLTYKYGSLTQFDTQNTNAKGNYSFTADGANFIIAPSDTTKYDFSPASHSSINAPTGPRNFTATPKLGTTRTISGSLVYFGQAIAGATLTATIGTDTVATTSDMSGRFTLQIPAGKQATVTITKQNYIFPAILIQGHCNNASYDNYSASSGPASLFGYVKDSAGVGVQGVKILGDGALGAVTTDTSGRFDFPTVTDGTSFVITPSKTGFLFTPDAKSGTVTGATQVDFIADPIVFPISGTISFGANKLAEVTVRLTANGKTVVTQTDGNGNYFFAGLQAGVPYTVVPEKTGYNFTPPSAGNVLSAAAKHDFSATLKTFTLSGQVIDSSSAAGLGGVTISGGSLGSPTTDSSGNFSFTNVPYGTAYSLTASRNGYKIPTPSNASGTVQSNTVVQFTAEPLIYSLTVLITKNSAGFPDVPVPIVVGTTRTTPRTGSDGTVVINSIPYNSAYSVTPPTLLGYRFDYVTSSAPQRGTFNTSVTDLTVSYAATPLDYLVCAVLKAGTTSIDGATVKDTVTGIQLTTISTGRYCGYLPFGKGYSVTATKEGYTFDTPKTGTVGVSNPDIAITATELTYTITGKVTNSKGEPVSGAVVSDPGASKSATTSSDGSYSLREYKYNQSYALLVSQTNYKSFAVVGGGSSSGQITKDSVINFSGTPQDFSLCAIVLEGSSSIRTVSVVDSVSGKSLELNPYGKRCVTLPFGSSYSVTATKPGYTFDPVVETGTIAATNPDITFTGTKKPYTITGSVKRSNGVAVSGVVIADANNPALKATTDNNGNYSISGYFIDNSYSLLPSKTGYKPFTAKSGTIQDDTVNKTLNVVNFIADPEIYDLCVTVKSGSTPLSGVVVGGTLNGAPLSPTATTGSDGKACIKAPFESTYALNFTKIGYQIPPANGTPVTGTVSGPTNLAVAAEAKSVTVIGYVKTATGTPLAGADVTVTGKAPVKTDAQGKYTLSPLPYGATYTVTAALASYTFNGPFNGTAISAVGPDFIGTNTAFTVSGSVKLGNLSKDPVANVSIQLLRGTTVVANTATTSNGTFTLAGIVEGTYTVKASDPNYSLELDIGQTDFTVTKASPTKFLRAIPRVQNPVYVVWNSYYEMNNILELVNPGLEELAADITLFDKQGNVGEVRREVIPPYGQTDLPLKGRDPNTGRGTNWRGFTKDSYGLIKIKFNRDQFDGRLSFYRLSNNPKNGYDFAFFLPFVTPLQGATNALFNTVQPSQRLSEEKNLVPNWLQLINLDQSSERWFTVRIYDSSGTEVFCKLKNGELIREPVRVRVNAFGREDLNGGHECPGRGRMGTIHIIPDTPNAPYLAQVFRYGYNTDGSKEPTAFSFALPILATKPNGRTQQLPISRGAGAENVVEIANTLGVPTTVSLIAYNSSGQPMSSKSEILPPYAHRTVPANQFLVTGESGVIRITPDKPTSLIAASMFFFRSAATGSIQGLYGAQSIESFGRKQSGSYNLHLGQYNWLKLCNNRGAPTRATVLVNAGGAQYSQIIPIGPYGCEDTDIHNNQKYGTQPNTYGVIEVTGEEFGDLTAQLLRIRFLANGAVDYAAPTPLR